MLEVVAEQPVSTINMAQYAAFFELCLRIAINLDIDGHLIK
jgi:hypothetical protein